MIVIESKKKSEETIKKMYPDAMIIDVTSNAKDEFIKLSPFYPHGGIPVPFMEGKKASCVEAIWQGLKVFENADVDLSLFRNNTMKNLKRTVRKFGKPLGHKKGTELLGYIEARKEIYIPSYYWMLENICEDLVKKIRIIGKCKTVVLLDYDTNENVDDPKKPLSHASLIKRYIEENTK